MRYSRLITRRVETRGWTRRPTDVSTPVNASASVGVGQSSSAGIRAFRRQDGGVTHGGSTKVPVGPLGSQKRCMWVRMSRTIEYNCVRWMCRQYRHVIPAGRGDGVNEVLLAPGLQASSYWFFPLPTGHWVASWGACETIAVDCVFATEKDLQEQPRPTRSTQQARHGLRYSGP